jgi:hypothetical protein
VNLFGAIEIHELPLDQIKEIALLRLFPGKVLRRKGIESEMLDAHLQAPVGDLLRGLGAKAVAKKLGEASLHGIPAVSILNYGHMLHRLSGMNLGHKTPFIKGIGRVSETETHSFY